ncbi:MAG: autotransporter domain-containing protein [Gammaproteobacteria bacterium]|nr:autotransporter domain-containing protein [Gammaproteobacteria bacterium]
MGGFYGNATFSNADLKLTAYRRNVRLGITNRVNNASTNGSNASGSVMVGYDFQLGSVAVGPFVGMTSQAVSVGGFRETQVRLLRSQRIFA